jgi:predicted nucleotidyltransferase
LVYISAGKGESFVRLTDISPRVVWRRHGIHLGKSQAREQELLKELDRITGILRARNVEKIVLFGSLARGEVSSTSDIDLIVVIDTNKRFLDRLHDLYSLVQPKMAVDLVVYTPQELSRLRDTSTFVRKALLEGKVLYEKDSSGRGNEVVSPV